MATIIGEDNFYPFRASRRLV